MDLAPDVLRRRGPDRHGLAHPRRGPPRPRRHRHGTGHRPGGRGAPRRPSADPGHPAGHGRGPRHHARDRPHVRAMAVARHHPDRLHPAGPRGRLAPPLAHRCRHLVCRRPGRRARPRPRELRHGRGGRVQRHPVQRCRVRFHRRWRPGRRQRPAGPAGQPQPTRPRTPAHRRGGDQAPRAAAAQPHRPGVA
ncbi:hypothetical protein ACFFX0_02610 [Citricoccus parietis]|uniref:Uncharacterized protein n=1 Tax=Citricoccus parietis TaxID=592307 RepID=A0ABV5FTY8_9MICC